jgi:hypothetical protein
MERAMTRTRTEQTQPAVAELLARIEELEERLTRRRGLRRLLSGRLGIMAGLVFMLVFGPTFASLAGAASPASTFCGLTGNSLTTGQFLGTTNPELLVLKTNGITAMTIGAGGGSTPGNVAVAGKLNAVGGLQENGSDLSSKYAFMSGSNASGTWGINITGNAATATSFTGSLSGDVTGGQSSTRVGALQGHPVDSTAPSDGQVLKWDGSNNKWAPGTDGTLTGNGTGGTPLAVNPSAIQVRVSGACTTGSTISAVNAHGSVSCQTCIGGLQRVDAARDDCATSSPRPLHPVGTTCVRPCRSEELYVWVNCPTERRTPPRSSPFPNDPGRSNIPGWS